MKQLNFFQSKIKPTQPVPVQRFLQISLGFLIILLKAAIL